MINKLKETLTKLETNLLIGNDVFLRAWLPELSLFCKSEMHHLKVMLTLR
jgi:hypothetical protein